MTDVDEHNGGERDDDVVAAEYVLGVLPPAEHAEAADRVGSDRNFAMAVAVWEERLSGMNEAYGETAPPASVWRGIEARLFAMDPSRRRANAGMWSSLVFWRGLALASLVATAVLAAVVVREASQTVPVAELVASLSPVDSEASFVAVRENDGTLRVASVGAEPPAGRDHELWVIVGENAPVSLGVVTADALTTVLPQDVAALDPSLLTLAVTVEPLGGSPSGDPTGPVVAAGQLKKI